MKIKRIIAVLLVLVLTAMMFPSEIPAVYVYAADEYGGDLRWDFISDTENVETFSLGAGADLSISHAVVDGEECLKITNNNSNDSNIFNAAIELNLGGISSEYRYLRFRMKNISRIWEMPIRVLDENRGGYAIKPMVANTHPTKFVEYEVDLLERTVTWYFSDGSSPITFSYNLMSGSVENMSDMEGYEILSMCFVGNATNNVEGYTGEIFVDYIMMSNTSKLAAEAIQPVLAISIGEEVLTEFEPSVQCYERMIEYDTYNMLSEQNVAEIINATLSNDAEMVGIKYQNGKNKKIADITAKVGTAYRTYRIIIKSKPKPVMPVDMTLDMCEWQGKRLAYSGTLSPEGKRPITLQVKSGDEILWYGVVQSNTDGSFSGTLGIYDEETEARKAEVDIVFDVLGFSEQYIIKDSYINDTYMEEIAAGLSSVNGKVMDYVVGSEADSFERMGVWVDEYNSLSDDEQASMSAMVEDVKSEITKNNAAELINGSYVAVVIDEMNAEEGAELITRLCEVSDILSVSGKNFADLSDKEKAWVVENAVSLSKLDGWEDLKLCLRQSMLLNTVNSSPYIKLAEILKDNADILNNDIDSLEENNTTTINGVMKNIAAAAQKKPYTDVEGLVADIKNEFEKTESDKNTGGGGGSGGSSSGGGGGSSSGGSGASGGSMIGVSSNAEVTSQDKENVTIFKDMIGYEWAEEAVVKLYNIGVVNGIGDERFEPGFNVKREEFVKMIVKTFGKTADSVKITFTDVNENSWCAPYLSAAAEMKIITGMPDGSFGAGRDVTREDMAVILMRALQAEGYKLETIGADFADENNVAEYANDAVKMLSGAGIINGVGNGMFAPKAPATRAEAAVMLYRCVEKIANYNIQ